MMRPLKSTNRPFQNGSGSPVFAVLSVGAGNFYDVRRWESGSLGQPKGVEWIHASHHGHAPQGPDIS
jgi:hypothetical protein